jgi:hypothetical protein
MAVQEIGCGILILREDQIGQVAALMLKSRILATLTRDIDSRFMTLAEVDCSDKRAHRWQ